MKNATTPVGRFAPTPSGDLHLGNLLCALVSYLSVKSKRGAFIVRIEDLDKERCPRSSADKILNTLHRFGLDPDEPPVFQSERGDFYAQKLSALDMLGLVYPCFCTRAELHAAEAPRLSDGGIVYSGKCKALTRSQREEKEKTRKPCMRVAVPDRSIAFEDGIKGYYVQNLRAECGDFIIRRSDGVFAYQLAVAADDGEQHVTEVFRGDDLLASTPRQLWLMSVLGYTPPKYYHLPLVCDSLGRKLSKSEGDVISLALRSLPPERILGGLAFAAGLIQTDRAAELSELIETFDANNIKRDPIRLPQTLCVV